MIDAAGATTSATLGANQRPVAGFIGGDEIVRQESAAYQDQDQQHIQKEGQLLFVFCDKSHSLSHFLKKAANGGFFSYFLRKLMQSVQADLVGSHS